MMQKRRGVSFLILAMAVSLLASPLARAATPGNLLVPPRGKILLGSTDAVNVARLAGKVPAIWHVKVPWGGGEAGKFPSAWAREAVAAGAIPMITWQWCPPAGKGKSPIDEIASGRQDDYATDFLKTMGALDTPFFLRFPLEVGFKNYPLKGGSIKDPAKGGDVDVATFKKAFCHVAELSRKLAPRGLMVWSTATGLENTNDAYPGDEWVDWIGCSFQNAPKYPKSAKHMINGGWYKRYILAHHKPGMICELSSADAFTETKDWGAKVDGKYPQPKAWVMPEFADKARWIDESFEVLEKECTEIRAYVWLNQKMEWDGRIDSSPAALAAFKKRAASDFCIGATGPK